jgi:polar amino acid transport system substrate-binding protein
VVRFISRCATVLIVGALAVLNAPQAMARCATATVIGGNGWFPISFQRDGVAAGLGMDVAREALMRAGVHSVATRSDQSFADGLRMVEAGAIDVFAGAYFTEDRANRYHYTDSFAADEIRVFTTQSNQFVFNQWPDLVGWTGNRPAGGSYGDAFDAFAEEWLTLHAIPSQHLLFRQLLNGQVDYTVLALADGLELRQAMNATEIVALPTPVVSNPVYLLVSKRSPCAALLDEINQHIEEMRLDGTMKVLTRRYVLD